MILRMGYFCELGHGSADGPSLTDAVGRLDVGDSKEAVVNYLRSCDKLAVSGSSYIDVLRASDEPIGPLMIYTDGQWMWPSDLPYYVDRYDVALPTDFLAWGDRRHWNPSALSVDDLQRVADELLG